MSMLSETTAAGRSPLLSPLQIGAWRLPNRIVMAPLTRCRASAGRVPNKLMVTYYRQRARAGLILSEATSVDPMGVGYPDTPGIWTDAQIEGWKPITEAVHEAGGTILLQLWHVGRISDPCYLDGALPVAPSALAPKGHVSLVRPRRPFVTPRALATEEIPGVVEAYRQATENARKAGFDGVELHGANGYLLQQFLLTGTNQRTDAYGGSIENRARLMLEAVDAAISVWGADRVGLHLSPPALADHEADTDPRATYTYVAQAARQRKLAFLFIREPQTEPRLLPELKRHFGGVVIANQELDLATAETLLRKGEADACSWGQQFIANPDLVRRFAEGLPLNKPDPKTYFTSGPEGYIDYPFFSAETAEPDTPAAAGA